MKKHPIVIAAILLFGMGVVKAQNTNSVISSNSENLEQAFSQWDAMMSTVQASSGASDADFATFIRFEETELQVGKNAFISESRKANFEPMAVAASLQNTKEYVYLVYRMFNDTKKTYPSSVEEYKHPLSSRAIFTANPCDSLGCSNLGFENGDLSGW